MAATLQFSLEVCVLFDTKFTDAFHFSVFIWYDSPCKFYGMQALNVMRSVKETSSFNTYYL